jgi:hypothetical protein
MNVGLTVETARDAGIPVETELQLETTPDRAREIAAKLIATADHADELNRLHDLPVGDRDNRGHST